MTIDGGDLSVYKPSMHVQSIHLEPVGGVAGDMLLAALCDLGADATRIARVFDSLNIEGLELRLSPVDVDGERALRVQSIPPADQPRHRHLDEILALIDAADAPNAARTRAKRVFGFLGDAEAKVHGGTAASVHLHEVGQLDSILDVLGIAVALDSLGNPPLSCSPLPIGHGQVETQHGTLTCPVPAVREIAARYRVPLVEVDVEGETVTPTGIAVVAEACQSWTTAPRGLELGLGVGAGTRRFSGLANVVRAIGYRTG